MFIVCKSILLLTMSQRIISCTAHRFVFLVVLLILGFPDWNRLSLDDCHIGIAQTFFFAL